MKSKFLVAVAVIALIYLPKVNFAQAPNLGSAANFVLFTSNGPVTNTGISRITGNVGTNNGSSTGFGNVDGSMHDGGAISTQCATDLLIAYYQLDNAVPNYFIAPSLGSGQTLTPGTYSISSAATLNAILNLDAQNNPNAVFNFKIQGSFSTNAFANVKLINGTQACNVFWKAEGMVSMATGTTMRGTVIANNSAIHMSTGGKLEGRLLSTDGAVTIDGIMAYTPIGCGSPVLTGPAEPTLGEVACYALFSATGDVANAGITQVTGDVGTNSGSPTGFDTAYVEGTVHQVPDFSTAQCATDLQVLYSYLNLLPVDIELLYPAQFGNGLVLTPHTYLMDAATVFTDTVFLNAQGNANAIFVIKINGALSTGTYATVKLINGARSENVFWKIEGAVGINNYSLFNGTVICNNGALGALNTGVVINGRALTTSGALNTTAITAAIQSGCGISGVEDLLSRNEIVSVYPNPFTNSISISVNITSSENIQLHIYNTLGEELSITRIHQQTTIATTHLPSGIYFYKLTANNRLIQTGRLVSQQ